MKKIAATALSLGLLLSMFSNGAFALEFQPLKMTFAKFDDGKGEWFTRVYHWADTSKYEVYRMQAMTEEVADLVDSLRPGHENGQPVECQAKSQLIRGQNQTINVFAIRDCK